ncbi:hypothetical protein NEFER03_1701 [Nematocida sp. LUAm3]|nr:hypothetical protein NEFER03_1701 [Nematocida sp. LUAm3]KAI5175691.1 hypothetical protein NEFER02_1578 [Nematocida sp. LUAm2]KAI5178597.1 hypothetical protein NEFER01_1733 [Nematocida sp. LUAm1]
MKEDIPMNEIQDTILERMEKSQQAQKNFMFKCRICHEEEEKEESLIESCLCRGDLRYAHEKCLIKWIVKTSQTRCVFCSYTVEVTRVKGKELPTRVSAIQIIGYLVKSIFYTIVVILKEVLCLSLQLSLFLVLGASVFFIAPGKHSVLDIFERHPLKIFMVGWLVYYLFLQKAKHLFGAIVLLCVKTQKRVGSKHEDMEMIEEEDDTGELDTESILHTLGAVSNLQSFSFYRRKKPGDEGVTLSSEDICSIFKVILLEENNATGYFDLFEEGKKELFMRYPHLKSIWSIPETYYILPFFLRTFYALLCFFTGFLSFYVYYLAGKLVMYTLPTSYFSFSIPISSISLFSFVLSGKSFEQVKMDLRRVEGFMGLSLSSLIICAFCFYLTISKSGKKRMKKFKFEEIFYLIYGMHKQIVLWVAEEVLLPLATGLFLVFVGKKALKYNGSLVPEAFMVDSRVLGVFLSIIVIGKLWIYLVDLGVKELVKKGYREGVLYWIHGQTSRCFKNNLQEKVSISLLGIFISFLEGQLLFFLIVFPIWTAKTILTPYFFSGFVFPTTLSFISLLERAYFYSLLLFFTLSLIKTMLMDLLIKAPLLISKRLSLFFELDAFLFDGDTPIKYMDGRDLSMFKYLPAKKDIEYRREEVSVRANMPITIAELYFYYSRSGVKKRLFPTKRFLDVEHSSDIWLERVFISSREDLLFNPAFSLFFLPSFFLLKVLLYFVFFLLLILSSFTILVFCASGAYIALSHLKEILSAYKHLEYTLSRIRSDTLILLSFACISVVYRCIYMVVWFRKEGAFRICEEIRNNAFSFVSLVVMLPTAVSITLMMFISISSASPIGRMFSMYYEVVWKIAFFSASLFMLASGKFFFGASLLAHACLFAVYRAAGSLLFSQAEEKRVLIHMLMVFIPFILVYFCSFSTFLSKRISMLPEATMFDIYLNNLKIIPCTIKESSKTSIFLGRY